MNKITHSKFKLFAFGLLTLLASKPSASAELSSSEIVKFFSDYESDIVYSSDKSTINVEETLLINGYKPILERSLQQEIFSNNWEKLPEEERKCLTDNMIYESANQGTLGLTAVAEVTLMRVADKRYPNTICDVVHQKKNNKKGVLVCQFSWVCKNHDWKPSKKTATLAENIASFILNIGILPKEGITNGSTHYHASYMTPYWAPSLQMVAVINQHIFYK